MQKACKRLFLNRLHIAIITPRPSPQPLLASCLVKKKKNPNTQMKKKKKWEETYPFSRELKY